MKEKHVLKIEPSLSTVYSNSEVKGSCLGFQKGGGREQTSCCYRNENSLPIN